MTLESTIEKMFVAAVKKKGGMTLKLTGYQGIPDRLVLMPHGDMMFVELKQQGKKPRRRQDVMAEKLRELGYKVWIIDNQDVIDQVLEATNGINSRI